VQLEQKLHIRLLYYYHILLLFSQNAFTEVMRLKIMHQLEVLRFRVGVGGVSISNIKGVIVHHEGKYVYRAPFFILYYDQQVHNYFTNYHTSTCFDTIVSSSGSL